MDALWVRELEGGPTAYKSNKVARLTAQVYASTPTEEQDTEVMNGTVVKTGGTYTRAGDCEALDGEGNALEAFQVDTDLERTGGAAPIAGDHYAEVRSDELKEAEKALELLEKQADTYQELIEDLEMFNAVQEWAKSDFLINVEVPDLTAVNQEHVRGADEKMARSIAFATTFLANAEEGVRKAEEEFNKLKATGDEAPLLKTL